MWSLERPTLSARSAFATCISRVRNAGLAARLANAAPTIVAASAQFDRAARRHRLHEIATHDEVAPDITVGEMEKVYTQRMAKSGAPGRDIYDEIFASAPSGRCPLCMQRFVATLDHHLPKAHYPALAVAPLNLIPACSDCNKAKLDAVPATAEDVSLHPYYDDLGDEVWLTAIVVECRPSALRFEIARSRAWDDTLFARVNRHFRSLGLAALFASEAAEESGCAVRMKRSRKPSWKRQRSPPKVLPCRRRLQRLLEFEKAHWSPQPCRLSLESSAPLGSYPLTIQS